MRAHALLILFVISCGLSSAQTPDIDSLIRNLENFPKNDSMRAQLLLDVALKPISQLRAGGLILAANIGLGRA